MEYRALPRGGEQISVLGLGMGGMNKDSISGDEIEALIRKAVLPALWTLRFQMPLQRKAERPHGRNCRLFQ